MTTDISQTMEEPLISVIGIGEDSKKYIDEIKEWDSPLVSAKMLDRNFTGPEPGIEMAILIITENVNATILAKNLKQSGLLTIIVASCEIRAMEGSYDSITKVPGERIINTIKTLVDILAEMPSYICLDINDVCYVMKDSCSFQAFSLSCDFENQGMQSIIPPIKERLAELKGVNKLLFKISISKDQTESIKMEEILKLQNFLPEILDNVSIMWGVDISDKLSGKDCIVNFIATVRSRRE